MASIDALQDYDIIYTLTFDAGDTGVGKTSPIVLYRGSASAYSGTVYYRAGTSGAWTSLSVSGTSTTFPVSSTTMQVAHDWNKSGNNYMTASFYDGTSGSNAKTIVISQKAVISGVVGNNFMYQFAIGCTSLTSLDVPVTSNVTSVGNSFMGAYAQDCTSLTSLAIPDTSNITSTGNNFLGNYARNTGLVSLDAPNTSSVTTVGNNFMINYAYNSSSLVLLAVPNTANIITVGDSFLATYARACSSLTSLDVPDTSNITSVGGLFMDKYVFACSGLIRLNLPTIGWFASNNVDWSMPAGRLGYVKGYVKNATDKSNWDALVTSGNTLYTNYIRSTSDVILEADMSGAMMWFLT